MSDPLSEMVEKAQVDLPRCPGGAILQELRSSAKTFAERSEGWRRWIRIDVVLGTVSYKLNPPGTGIIKTVVCAVLGEDENNGYEIPASEYSIRVANGDTFIVFRCSLGSSRLAWLHVRCQFVPSKTAPIDDIDWIDRWSDGIVHHCIYTLARRPGRPWSSRTVSENHYRDYIRVLDRAKRENVTVDAGISYSGGVNV